MILGKPVQVRLHEETKRTLELEAARKGKPFETFLRDLIEDREMREEPSALRSEVLFLGNLVEALQAGLNSQTIETDRTMIMETLLLTRSLAGPERMHLIHAEMRKRGFQPGLPQN